MKQQVIKQMRFSSILSDYRCCWEARFLTGWFLSDPIHLSWSLVSSPNSLQDMSVVFDGSLYSVDGAVEIVSPMRQRSETKVWLNRSRL